MSQQKPQVGEPRAEQACTTPSSGSGVVSKVGGRCRCGSRRAATGACRDPKICRQSVTDHDRRSTQREAAYLGFLSGSHGPQCPGVPPGKCSVGTDTEGVTGSNPVAP